MRLVVGGRTQCAGERNVQVAAPHARCALWPRVMPSVLHGLPTVLAHFLDMLVPYLMWGWMVGSVPNVWLDGWLRA